MHEIISVNKPIGMTPLGTIYAVKHMRPELRALRMGYAGRLDPMARGVLLLLVDEACADQEKFQTCDKEYEFEALFGIASDTYDILGMPSGAAPSDMLEEKVLALVPHFTGEITQELPPYSSYIVEGKPLVVWAREGRLGEITLPKRAVEIFSLEHIDTRTISSEIVRDEVIHKLATIHGDFRQELIREQWGKVLKDAQGTSFLTMKFRAHVSSGTYIRSLVHVWGQELGVGALTLDIYRTRVGDYVVEDALQL